MLITEFVDVKIYESNMQHYKNMGYNIKHHDVITVPVEHLPKNSNVLVDVVCDYCGEHVFKKYGLFLKGRENFKKDSCKKCKGLKAKESNLEKYGVESVTSLESVKEKTRQTNLERYGVESPMQCPEIKEKLKQTFLELYGVESPSCLPEIKEKIKQTCIDRYGVESYLKTEECQKILSDFWENVSEDELEVINKKKKNSNFEKFGVENLMDSPEIREKIKTTCLEKYGTENPLGNIEIREKAKQTILDKYGVEYIMQNPEYIEKAQQTNIGIYGFANPMCSHKVQEKAKKTLLKNYGVDNPNKSPIIRERIKKTCLKRYGVETNLQLPETREKAINSFITLYGIPTSKPQIMIYELIKQQLYEDVVLNYKHNYYFLDIALFINKLKIDIEYDGWYWHKDTLKKDEIRNKILIKNDWKILRIKSNEKIPTFNQLQESLNILINTEEKYQEIILDDWGYKEDVV